MAQRRTDVKMEFVEPRTGAARASRADTVFEELLRAIQNGRYNHGARIREEEVARSLGVSRTPVREALSRLQGRGLLEMSPSGLVVARLTRPQLIELYDIREILEGSAARFAAQHAAPGEIAALNRMSEIFAKSPDDPKRLARLNREFHGAIYEAAHNRYVLRMLEELHDALTLLSDTTFMVPGRGERAAEEHAAIVAAIEERDADKAERLARRHIQLAQETRLEMLLQD